jgi:chromate transporter
MSTLERSKLPEIALAFLKFGVTAYGGLAAVWGVMQADLQEKRGWLSRERFLEGLALVNMLPGAVAVQLCIFLGYSRAGWWGGLVAGLSFILPAFLIMLGLTLTYAAFGATPVIQGALYGIGPVIVAIFLAATWRLSKTAAATMPQLLILVAAALAAAFSPVGTAPILLIAGAIGVLLFHSRAKGFVALGILLACTAIVDHIPALLAGPASSRSTGVFDIGAFFFTVGALSFGGGLTMIAFIQDQVVNQYQWLTQREFIDGLALGQLTPGPILMVSAYVGYKLAGLVGAAVATAAIFLPAFILMMSVLPVFERARKLLWLKAAIRGIGPAVIGVLLVSLGRLAPHAVPDPVAALIFALALAAILGWTIGPLRLMLAGALIGAFRERMNAISAAAR